MSFVGQTGEAIVRRNPITGRLVFHLPSFLSGFLLFIGAGFFLFLLTLLTSYIFGASIHNGIEPTRIVVAVFSGVLLCLLGAWANDEADKHWKAKVKALMRNKHC
jgi:hypothetical protein